MKKKLFIFKNKLNFYKKYYNSKNGFIFPNEIKLTSIERENLEKIFTSNLIFLSNKLI